MYRQHRSHARYAAPCTAFVPAQRQSRRPFLPPLAARADRPVRSRRGVVVGLLVGLPVSLLLWVALFLAARAIF